MARLEHFAIYAANSTSLKDFYVDAFGMKVVLESGGDPAGYFLADEQGMAIEIIGRPAKQQAVNQRWVCHLAFWVDDVAAKRRELEHARHCLRDRNGCRHRRNEDCLLSATLKGIVARSCGEANPRRVTQRSRSCRDLTSCEPVLGIDR